MSSGPNLIITSAYGARFQVPFAFLASARNAGMDARIIFIRHKADKKFLEGCQAIYPNVSLHAEVCNSVVDPLCKIMARIPKLGRLFASAVQRMTFARKPDNAISHVVALHLLNQMCSRFLIARKILMSDVHAETKNVLLVDSRDVIFQADPFATISPKLTNGEEFPIVMEEESNRRWIERVYGNEPQVFNALAPQKVLCAGVTIGSRDAVLEYLNEMAHEIYRKLPQLAFAPGVDQIVHNKVMRTSPHLDYLITKNGDPLIANLATTGLSHYQYSQQQGLRNLHGDLISIVHQYDRHKTLDSIVPEGSDGQVS